MSKIRRRASRHSASRELVVRLLQLVAWKPDRDDDGADPIGPEVAARSLAIVEDCLDIVDEPSVIPAKAGSIALVWHLGSDRTVTFYVDADGVWRPASLRTGDDHASIETPELRALRSLLAREQSAAA